MEGRGSRHGPGRPVGRPTAMCSSISDALMDWQMEEGRAVGSGFAYKQGVKARREPGVLIKTSKIPEKGGRLKCPASSRSGRHVQRIESTRSLLTRWVSMRLVGGSGGWVVARPGVADVFWPERALLWAAATDWSIRTKQPSEWATLTCRRTALH